MPTQSASNHPPSFSSPTAPSFDLVSRILALLGWDRTSLPTHDADTHQGPRRKLETWQLVVGLIAHCLPFSGRFSQCISQYFGVNLSDSALSQRRKRLDANLFNLILEESLHPLADPNLHPDCFLKSLRLVGIDGTTWSVSNTPQHLKRMAKAKTRRGPAAFAKIIMSVLVELGTHTPLRAAIGLDKESEDALSAKLMDDLPERSLLILDRLYGNAPTLARLQERCRVDQEQFFLTRVRSNIGAKTRQLFADGSALVEVELRDKIKKGQVLQKLLVREVRGRVWKRNEKKWVEVRLWTNLSLEQASAIEILKLYARRWEQEIFYRELKLQVACGDLLQSHTPETAQQEIAALLIASALVAQERLAIADEVGGEVQQAGVMRISMSICLEQTLALWVVLTAAQGLMDEAAQRELVRRMRQQIADCALPPRRERSCERKVRQPIKKWPRMITPTSKTSPTQIELIPIA